MPMIQEAHIGVGIVGKEGLQAAKAADYSIGKFKFLSRLVLVHGHWAYHRTCLIAQYSFYKSVFFCMFQLFFNLRSGFSGVSWFMSTPITLYNAPFTGLAPFFFIFDRDVSEASLLNPRTYSWANPYGHGMRGDYMNWRTILISLGSAVVQGLAVAMLVLPPGSGECQDNCTLYPAVTAQAGRTLEADAESQVTYTGVILIQTAIVFLISNTLTVWNHFAVWLCLALYVVMLLLLGHTTMLGTDLFGMESWLIPDAAFWLSILLALAVAVVPLGFIKATVFWHSPLAFQEVQHRERAQSQGERGGSRDGPTSSTRRLLDNRAT